MIEKDLSRITMESWLKQYKIVKLQYAQLQANICD